MGLGFKDLGFRLKGVWLGFIEGLRFRSPSSLSLTALKQLNLKRPKLEPCAPHILPELLNRKESSTTVFEDYPGYSGDLPDTSGGVKATAYGRILVAQAPILYL